MKIKKRKFETNPATSGKNIADLKVNMVKKYGLLRLWQWWREDNEKYTRLMERR